MKNLSSKGVFLDVTRKLLLISQLNLVYDMIRSPFDWNKSSKSIHPVKSSEVHLNKNTVKFRSSCLFWNRFKIILSRDPFNKSKHVHTHIINYHLLLFVVYHNFIISMLQVLIFCRFYFTALYVWGTTSWLAFCNTTIDVLISFFLAQCKTQLSIVR